ncbi:hypothetical protein HanXRQr2_Chr05g0207981 [Helianthus annuus]|uniref:Uncharacterized protein n=1 Tax=Helianthus annuus TaxID=4232 RepID=A0A251UP38_HELAN|nr:hypothetical protein HanXRQr2_Chr05g0207981 [Helianthus annuus]KAJ0922207.1 hypothetical protein HanPSC8_Chr05g0200951 [Helianthus annuus]
MKLRGYQTALNLFQRRKGDITNHSFTVFSNVTLLSRPFAFRANRKWRGDFSSNTYNLISLLRVTVTICDWVGMPRSREGKCHW